MGGPSHNEHERQPGAARHRVADTPVPTRLNIGTRCLITERRGFTVKTGAGTDLLGYCTFGRGQPKRAERDDMGVRRSGELSFGGGRGQPAVSRAGHRAALPSSRRRAAVSTATSGTRLGSDTTVIRSIPA